MFVRNRMTANPWTVTPEQSLPEAAGLLVEHKIRHLPVVVGDRVVGVLSKGDVDAAGPVGGFSGPARNAFSVDGHRRGA